MGLDGKGIAIAGGRHDGKRLPANFSGQSLNCPTAALFLDEDTLVVCNGSDTYSALAWSRDLLSLGQSGSVLTVDLGHDKASLVRGGLGFPAGIAAAPNGKLIVAEAWKHRLLTLAVDGSGLADRLA